MFFVFTFHTPSTSLSHSRTNPFGPRILVPHPLPRWHSTPPHPSVFLFCFCSSHHEKITLRYCIVYVRVYFPLIVHIPRAALPALFFSGFLVCSWCNCRVDGYPPVHWFELWRLSQSIYQLADGFRNRIFLSILVFPEFYSRSPFLAKLYSIRVYPCPLAYGQGSWWLASFGFSKFCIVDSVCTFASCYLF